ncbi:galactokinase [Pontimicrobium sp. IMCC45349]|uniref:galactokinase n=1 Tax=Pontimicrobium sp. IMCC45349 TaxID=3391574 RepID=UPI0039A16AF8
MKELKQKIHSRFKAEFKSEPILVFAPGRINLIGEHTDYNNGYVLPAAIDKGIVVAIQKNNNQSSNVIANDINENFTFSVNNTSSKKKGDWRNYIIGIVNELLKAKKPIENFNLVFGGNIPNGSGMSSSAALENSIVFGLNELFNLNLTKEEMIFISQKAEHNYVGVNCGIMDQYASMFGKKDTAILLDCKDLKAKTIDLILDKHTFLLINTNVKHSLAESAYNERRAVCEQIASLLNKNSLREVSEDELVSIKEKLSDTHFQKALYVIQENNRVLEAVEAIHNNDVQKLGALLFASHRGLQKQYKVSCKELDFLVDYAQKSDTVIGARMMGGGFGGCTINLIKIENVEAFKTEISQLYNNTFKNECSTYTINLGDGTKLISND